MKCVGSGPGRGVPLALAVATFCTAIVAGSRMVDPHIIGGEVAPAGKFPEIVSLQYNNGNGPEHLCGGSVLDEYWVLTAAHCVDGVDPVGLSVLGGTVDLQNGGSRVEVEAYIVHDEYQQTNYLTHDVAVLRLMTPLPLSEQIQLVTLQQELPPAGEKAAVVGWGQISNDAEIASNTLQFAEVDIVGNDKCQKSFEGYATIFDNQMCAGTDDGGKGECKGDSGGPLFVDGMQVGVVSWSKKPCGAAGVPGVFASVAKHVGWIRKVTNLPHI